MSASTPQAALHLRLSSCLPPMSRLVSAKHARRLAYFLRTATVASASRNYSSIQAASATSPSISIDTSLPLPSLPPRPANITDGTWDRADADAVKQALADADKIARQAQKYGAGEVLLARTLDELKAIAAADGQPGYRAKQLRDGVLQGARSVEDISTIPKAWRQALIERGVSTGRSVLHHEVSAADGTKKFLLRLHDGYVVETVGIPVDDEQRSRLTVCVSSQVGCPMRCTFCATGKGGFARNLMPYEIVDQVLTVQEQFGQRVTNVVFMGMGEPALNLPSVMRAHSVLNQELGIGARHITISTVGVPNSIQMLARHDTQSTLAVSIHAPNQKLREEIVPSAKAYPIDALLRDCAEYFDITGRRVTFEYVLLAGVNDGVEHAQELAAVLRRHGSMKSHVNVIPWNPVDESEFSRPTKRGVQQFIDVLAKNGIAASVRHTRGLEAAAACGQLRNRHQKEPLEAAAAVAVAGATP